MDTVLQRKPFLRPPSQYEKMCLRNLVIGLLSSSLLVAFSPIDVLVPNSNPYDFGVIDLIFIPLACMILIPFVICMHIVVKDSLISFNKLHVFGLCACSLIGYLIPKLFHLTTVDDSQFLSLLFICCKNGFIDFLIVGLYTLMFVEAK